MAFVRPLKTRATGDAGRERRGAESFANVRTSGPSGPTNPWAKWGEEGGSREVNCKSFRVLPLHSRALYFPFPSMRSDPSLSSYTLPSSRGNVSPGEITLITREISMTFGYSE